MERDARATDPVVYHLEMVALVARGTGTRAFFEHLAKARACVEAEERPARGALTPWQRERAEAMLLAGLEGETSLDDVARDCGLSRARFTRAFARSVGLAPRAWLRAMRVETAKRLMRDRSRTLSEIAAITGFADQSHLSRTFKRATGMSPTEFRRAEAG